VENRWIASVLTGGGSKQARHIVMVVFSPFLASGVEPFSVETEHAKSQAFCTRCCGNLRTVTKVRPVGPLGG